MAVKIPQAVLNSWLAQRQGPAGPQGPPGWNEPQHTTTEGDFDAGLAQDMGPGGQHVSGSFTGPGTAPYVPPNAPGISADGKMADGYVIGTQPSTTGPNGRRIIGYQDNGTGSATTPIYAGQENDPTHPTASTHPVIDAYGRELSTNMQGINESFAAEAAAINAHYDQAKANLHSNYNRSVGGVNAEGADTLHDLGVIARDARGVNARATDQINRTNTGTINTLQKGEAHDAAAMKSLGVGKSEGAPVAAAIHQTIATARANGATDAAFSTRMGQLTEMAINNREATSRLVTQSSLDDLRTLLSQGLTNIDMAKASDTAKANVAKIKAVAAAKSNYAQEVAARITYVQNHRTAAGGKPLTFSEKSQIATHTNPPNYQPAFKTLMAPGSSPALSQWANDALDSMVGTGTNPARNPTDMYNQFKKAGSIKGLNDDEYAQALHALDEARRNYISTTRNNNAWLAAHGYGS